MPNEEKFSYFYDIQSPNQLSTDVELWVCGPIGKCFQPWEDAQQIRENILT